MNFKTKKYNTETSIRNWRKKLEQNKGSQNRRDVSPHT